MRFARWLWLIAAGGTLLPAQAPATATVNIDTKSSTPLNAHFSGFNDEVPFPPEFYDYRLNDIAATLSPSWVRYPSGLFSQAFDWQTGLIVSSWAQQFDGTNVATLINEAAPWVAGKGGGSFVDGANRADFLDSKLIVAVNGYTDTAQSAGAMAAFAKANHIPVAVWELCNEPYLYPSFFSSGLDYVTKMKPYRDAIKAADPDAVVAIFFVDPGGDTAANPAWNQSILSYPDPYWDAVTFHDYPAQTATTFTQEMENNNGELATRTSSYVTGYLETVNPPGTKFLISEFLPSNDGLGAGTSLTDGTLYGAIYGAEFIMRMSTVPAMLYVGPHAMTGTRGVYAVNTHYTDVEAAANAGTSIDTLTLDFGFYLTAQQLGAAVLNGVLRNATTVNSTTVTGGATVAATGPGAMPALYAQGYSSATGAQSVVITNKSATVHQATIQINGTAVSGTLPITFIAGTDPTAGNTASNKNAVTVQTSTSSNPVTIPAYSVVRVDLTEPEATTAVNAASFVPGPVAPNELVTLYAPSLGTETLAASSQPPPASLGGISVEITDSSGTAQSAPVIAVSPADVSIVIPASAALGEAQVTVMNGTATAASGTLNIANSAPGLFSMNSDGAGVAAANALLYNDYSSLVAVETVFTCDPTYARSCLGAPLKTGSTSQTLYVTLYGTGIRNATSVQAFVAGQMVPVQYAGPTPGYAGLDQVNVPIPQSLAGSGDVRVCIVADGTASNVVGLTIQ